MSLAIKKLRTSNFAKSIHIGDYTLDVIPYENYSLFYYKKNKLCLPNIAGFNIINKYLYVVCTTNISGDIIDIYDINELKRLTSISLSSYNCNAIYIDCGRVTIEYLPIDEKSGMDNGCINDGKKYSWGSRYPSPKNHYVKILNEDGLSTMTDICKMKYKIAGDMVVTYNKNDMFIYNKTFLVKAFAEISDIVDVIIVNNEICIKRINYSQYFSFKFKQSKEFVIEDQPVIDQSKEKPKKPVIEKPKEKPKEKSKEKPKDDDEAVGSDDEDDVTKAVIDYKRCHECSAKLWVPKYVYVTCGHTAICERCMNDIKDRDYCNMCLKNSKYVKII